MKELILKQSTKHVLSMLHKIQRRNSTYRFTPRLYPEIDICYEIIQKGTYTACILTVDNEIIGIGMTKRNRNDKYNVKVALDVCIHKAIQDYLFGINPEILYMKEVI